MSRCAPDHGSAINHVPPTHPYATEGTARRWRRRPGRKTTVQRTPAGQGRTSHRPAARTASLLAGFAAVAALMAPAAASAAVTAPRDVISFPSRDFVSATGFKLADSYTVEVEHPDGTVSGRVTGLAPKDDGEGGGLGIIEINHPGGYCWSGVTPDIRPGDIVRFTDETTGAVDESKVRNVTDSRPVQ